MKNTNFDKSSSGVNIELSCRRDNDLSRFWFDENFHILQHSDYRQNSVLVYGMNWQDVSDFDFNDLDNWDVKKITVKFLRKFLVNEQGEDFSDIMSLNKVELFEEVYNYCPEDFTEFLTDNGAIQKFATVESRGYRQGDYSEVIIPECIIKELTDQTLDTIGDYLQEDIDHLLWDSPISCRAEVDEEQIYLDESLTDLYEWDKDKAIQLFKKGMDRTLNKLQYKTLISFLRENLPENPEYC